MIIVLKNNSQEKQVEELLNWLDQFHVSTNLVEGVHSNVIGLIGDTTQIDIEAVQAKECVENVQRVQEPYKNANRKFHPDNTVIDVAGRKIGGGKLQVIAGPCSVETEEQIITTAIAVKEAGATMLRGGAFKPRTSPYSFQGLGKEGIDLLIQARKITGLPTVTEIMDLSDLDCFADVDVVQVGARNMQNFTLLKALGRSDKPVLLKRGLSSTLQELLMSAEFFRKYSYVHHYPPLHLCDYFSYLLLGYLFAVLIFTEAHHLAYFFLENKSQLSVTDLFICIKLFHKSLSVDIIRYFCRKLCPFKKLFHTLFIFMGYETKLLAQS